MAKFKPKPAQYVPAAETREERRARRIVEARAKKAAKPRCEKPTVVVAFIPEPVEAPLIATPRESPPQPVRYSVAWEGPGDEFSPTIAVVPVSCGRSPASKRWRLRQWHEGNRRCSYCTVKLTPAKKDGQCTETTATVDHAQPLALGGLDMALNWLMCCWRCNNEKGAMTEAEFRALRMAAE
jgi:5-methylcytosine-specific restriction endonuclease McrA